MRISDWSSDVCSSDVVWMRGDVSPFVFLRAVQEAALIAFSTSSSNATLPAALKVAETDLNLPGRIARQVLGIGTVSNQSGTTIYVRVTVLFIVRAAERRLGKEGCSTCRTRCR